MVNLRKATASEYADGEGSLIFSQHEFFETEEQLLCLITYRATLPIHRGSQETPEMLDFARWVDAVISAEVQI
nr:hypothetical protein CFP56_53729 [Quercus suber]